MADSSSSINPDITRERQKATFSSRELTHFLNGGKANTERREYIEKLVFDDENFMGPDYNFMDRSQLYSEGIRKTTHMVKRIRELGLHRPEELYWFRSAIYPNENAPTTLHTGMFIPCLMGQASEEQQEQWLAKALNFEIIGTYAQTELGHGTFLRGLETTAVYDPATEEFILHSPTLTSTKWWPGGLGKTSNYAVVMAKLNIGNKSHGMQAFVVQLRDLQTHEPLPGITLGDIGPKFGYGMIDNGFLRMNKVRIPRTNMLMKNAKVQPDGTFIKSQHDKLGYGTMVFVRAMIVSDVAAKGLAQAIVIATRYSAVRHQSEIEPGAPEPQILEFQTQQYKLFPQLAAAYAFTFAGANIRAMYFRTNNQVLQGDVQMLPELHGLSAGLKAFTSSQAALGIEVCRMACGGHGYSQASGIPKIYGNAVPACTYEGENTVMYLQTARYLVKMADVALKNGELPRSVAYLGDNQKKTCRLSKAAELESLVDAFSHRAHRLVMQLPRKMSHQRYSKGLTAHDAWNAMSVVLTKASQAHIEYFVVKNFVDELKKITDPSIAAVMTQLCQLYAVHLLIDNAGDFFEDGYMKAEQFEQITEAELDLLAALRPNAVALVDAFNFHDNILRSVLGRYDGNVYENLYKWASAAPLNKTEVHESFHKYMKPFHEASKL